MSLLTIENVDFKYAGSCDPSLKNINLNLESNSLNVVIGPSGIGKTTLLNLIAGYDHPSTGQIKMAGKAIDQPDWQRGMVFQDMALFPWLTVADNILFGPKMRHLNDPEIQDRLTRLLAQTGLTDYRDAAIYELSGGLKQRVALAREFINQPPILMLDESFSALDNATRSDMHDILLNLWETTQNCVIAITHDIDEALFLGQNIIVINQHPGTIVSVEANPYFKKDISDLSGEPAYGAFRRRLLGLIGKPNNR